LINIETSFKSRILGFGWPPVSHLVATVPPWRTFPPFAVDRFRARLTWKRKNKLIQSVANMNQMRRINMKNAPLAHKKAVYGPN
jgi:hypothetical protein